MLLTSRGVDSDGWPNSCGDIIAINGLYYCFSLVTQLSPIVIADGFSGADLGISV